MDIPRSGTIYDSGYRDLGFEGPIGGNVKFDHDRGLTHNVVHGPLSGGGRGHFSWDNYGDGRMGGFHFTPDHGSPETIFRGPG